MSAASGANPAEILQWLGENWASALAEVVEGLAGQRPEAAWRASAAGATAPGEGAPLVWQQGFDVAEDALLWASVPEPVWRAAGAHVLVSAGVEEPADEEVRSTAIEILGQSFARLSQSLAERLGRPVATGAGAEHGDIPKSLPAGSVQLGFAGVAAGAMDLHCSPRLAALLAGPAQPSTSALVPVAASEPPDSDCPGSATLDLLRDMELPVSVSFGRTEMPLQEVLKLAAGSVIELDRSVNDPVALLVNDTVVALGEVVVIEGNYGLRISEILSREKLLRSSGLAVRPS